VKSGFMTVRKGPEVLDTVLFKAGAGTGRLSPSVMHSH